MKNELKLFVVGLAIVSMFFLSGNAFGTTLLYEDWENGISSTIWSIYNPPVTLMPTSGINGSQAAKLDGPVKSQSSSF